MKRRPTYVILVGWWLFVFVACAASPGPPLDELPMRDALRADPSAVASMSPDARGRLAARFEKARVVPEATILTAPADGVPAEVTEGDAAAIALAHARVSALDDARAEVAKDSLIVADIDGAGAEAVVDDEEEGNLVLALEGPAAASTAASEKSALTGRAAGPILALMRKSGAHRLVRVTGWPIAAAAVGDVVYVNASWLVALDDGSAPASESTGQHTLRLSSGPHDPASADMDAGLANQAADAGSSSYADGGCGDADTGRSDSDDFKIDLCKCTIVDVEASSSSPSDLLLLAPLVFLAITLRRLR